MLNRIVLLYSLFIGAFNLANGQYVSLSYARLHGKTIKTPAGNSASVFLGVPYAQPPLGALRYRRPVPVSSPLGNLDARAYGVACLSNTSATTSPQTVIGEDCLTANVFVSPGCAVADSPCPVLYYVHGGGWNFDSPRMFPPETLVDNFAANQVVMVTVGYRLGSFGFFDLGGLSQNEQHPNSTADLNVGLHDVIEGLRWVKREISAFGGDPNKVTIMGHSSGSMCVSLLTMSPPAKGLFHGAIAMSGSAFEQSAMYQTGINANQSRALAQLAGCLNDTADLPNDVDVVLECLRNKTAAELLAVQRQLEDDETIVFMGPSRDAELIPDELTSMVKGRTPVRYLIGTTVNEMTGALYNPNATEAQMLQESCRFATAGFQNPAIVAAKCEEHYKDLGLAAILAIPSDVGMFSPTWRDASNMRDLSNASTPVYLYSFDYPKRGAHAQDLTFVLGVHPFQYDQTDKLIGPLYASYFSDFARYGSPTNSSENSSWKPLEYPVGFNYYSIQYNSSNEDTRPKNEPFYHYDATQFWTSTAVAIDRGATEEADALRGSDATVTQQTGGGGATTSFQDVQIAEVTDNDGIWQTLFWIAVGIIILLLIIGLITCVVCFCGQKKRGDQDRTYTPYGDDDDDEEAPLVSGDPKLTYAATDLDSQPQPRYTVVPPLTPAQQPHKPHGQPPGTSAAATAPLVRL